MTVSHRRTQRALVRCIGIALAVLCMLGEIVPLSARAAGAPPIVSVDISGNQHVPTATITAVVQAKAGQLFDPKIVQDDLQRINQLGYFADVPPPLIRQRPSGIAITYRVVENPVLTKITFTGNKQVSSDTLLALMDSSVGQVFDTNTFRQDVLKINSYYENIGFRGELPSHVKDLHLDSATGVLALQIQEGLTIRHVIISGDPLIKTSFITPVLSVKPGTEYSDDLRDKDADAIRKLYDKYDLVLGNFEGGIDPSSIDLKNATADVKYDIWVARVGAVEITGNTKTKDPVIRRELRLRPGMVVSQSALKRDYDRLNNTQYFKKVDLEPKDGPDKKHPEYITLDWVVTEQSTATANVGFGYSGGLTGQGVYGTIGFSNSNLGGTGNGLSIQFQNGARGYSDSAQVTIPYVGNTPRTQRYSTSFQLFDTGQIYFPPVYAANSAIASVTGTSTNVLTPVTLTPTVNSVPLGVFATTTAKSAGATFQVGRRQTDYTRIFAGLTGEKLAFSSTVPAPFTLTGALPNVLAGPTPSPLGGATIPVNGNIGIAASSIANVNTGAPYTLYKLAFGIARNTLDDVFDPSHGSSVTLTEGVSNTAFGSSFNYTTTTLDASKFYPVLKNASLALHGLGFATTGVIPPSELYSFSDQQLRGYNSIFYGTDVGLAQAELRQPISADRKFMGVAFFDQGAFRIRGAAPTLDPFTNRTIGYPSKWTLRYDYGVGLRITISQLGNQTLRIDFAKSPFGGHTSFGIGESF